MPDIPSPAPVKSPKPLRRPPPIPLTTTHSLATPTTPVHTPISHGLRAQLNQLLPRHTLFHVRLHIHELASVPLINGEFGVKWKFKSVHAVPGSRPRLLRMVRGRSRTRTPSGKEKGKERNEGGEKDKDKEAVSSGIVSEDSLGSRSTSPTDESLSIPSVVVSRHHTLSTSSGPSTPGASTPHHTSIPEVVSSPAYLSPSLSSSRIPTLAQLADLNSKKQPKSSQSTPSLSATTPVDGYACPRGMTPFGELKDHRVIWEQTVDVIVKMDVERDTLNLLPNELKLEVMQRIIPNDPSSPSQPRLGTLTVNLAAYASTAATGSVTRRYLLRKSKTNATLKLTIQLEHVGGERNYIAPPLPKGEIFAGVSGVLDSDVLKMRPRLRLDGVERGLAGALINELGGKGMGWTGLSRVASAEQDHVLSLGEVLGTKLRNSPGVQHTHANHEQEVNGHPSAPPFNYSVDMFALAYSPRTTENLIEAIFNPVVTHDKQKEGPFTVYVDPSTVMKRSRSRRMRPHPSASSSPLSTVQSLAPSDPQGEDDDNTSIYSTTSRSSDEDENDGSPSDDEEEGHDDRENMSMYASTAMSQQSHSTTGSRHSHSRSTRSHPSLRSHNSQRSHQSHTSHRSRKSHKSQPSTDNSEHSARSSHGPSGLSTGKLRQGLVQGLGIVFGHGPGGSSSNPNPSAGASASGYGDEEAGHDHDTGTHGGLKGWWKKIGGGALEGSAPTVCSQNNDVSPSHLLRS